MIQEPNINASSNTSLRLIHKAGLYHPKGKCGIKNHIDQVGFKSCQNGSGIQKPEERQPIYRGFKDLMIESGIQKPHCAVDVPHSSIQKPEGEMCCGIQKPHGWEFNPTYKGFKNLIMESGIQKPRCAMVIAHARIQKLEEEHVLRDSKTASVGF